ncbi:Co-chaperone for ATPase activity [Schizosaccharomyces japonicus yFS275]|uniref:Co-chaperone for ATPase activity n=1 Tax=Schizosaccharomyces japonicus (strain yFS275 / FY16936) TaxID=402676 RepID=B6K8B4_SCHJY|nr:Co-chaperone for ATPase activity [Schizosaccharomyces japonicus yFS275]EEB09768.1 Co-chaperone for ATPase activity [Schizosaccharomyces japonicus yFS275]
MDISECFNVLRVPEDATIEEVKRSYRKLALRYHPDRNPGNDECHAIFSRISTAYDILTSDTERKWYERTAIRQQYKVHEDDLRRELAVLDSLQWKNSETYKILSGWCSFIELLKKDEDVAAASADPATVSNSRKTLPLYDPNLFLPWSRVKQFYQQWQRFNTIKTFDWERLYKEEDERENAVKKIMRRENLRIIQNAKASYNDLVRQLIRRMGELDPRKQNVVVLSEQERYDQLQASSRLQSIRDRRLNQQTLASVSLPEWTQVRCAAPYSDEDEESLSENDSVAAAQNETFFCTHCRKTFKTQQQLLSHERSKKHIKVVKQEQKLLRKQKRKAEKTVLQQTRAEEFADVESSDELTEFYSATDTFSGAEDEYTG